MPPNTDVPEDLVGGRAASFAEITKREGRVERQIRPLAPLAFISPQMISGLIDGRVVADGESDPDRHAGEYSWAKQ